MRLLGKNINRQCSQTSLSIFYILISQNILFSESDTSDDDSNNDLDIRLRNGATSATGTRKSSLNDSNGLSLNNNRNITNKANNYTNNNLNKSNTSNSYSHDNEKDNTPR